MLLLFHFDNPISHVNLNFFKLLFNAAALRAQSIVSCISCWLQLEACICSSVTHGCLYRCHSNRKPKFLLMLFCKIGYNKLILFTTLNFTGKVWKISRFEWIVVIHHLTKIWPVIEATVVVEYFKFAIVREPCNFFSKFFSMTNTTKFRSHI